MRAAGNQCRVRSLLNRVVEFDPIARQAIPPSFWPPLGRKTR